MKRQIPLQKREGFPIRLVSNTGCEFADCPVPHRNPGHARVAFNRDRQRLAVPAQLGVGCGQVDGVMGDSTLN